MSKESQFSFDHLGNEFVSCLKFIQYALVCPFLHRTYPQHSLVAPHFSCFFVKYAHKINHSNNVAMCSPHRETISPIWTGEADHPGLSISGRQRRPRPGAARHRSRQQGQNIEGEVSNKRPQLKVIVIVYFATT